MDLAQLWLESGESSLSVRHFRVEEQMSGLFRARVMARSPDEGIELGSLVGRAASLRLVNGLGPAAQERLFSGVCVDARMARAEGSSEGLSTYELTLVPSLWLLTQRRQNRLFQHISVPDIIDRLLREWGIEPEWRIDRGSFPPLELRVQYSETDYAFFSRLLEEAGVSFYFADDPQKGSRLVLNDRPHAAELRAGGAIPFVDATFQAQAGGLPFLTAVRLDEEVRPGRVTLRDYDFWNPRYSLSADAAQAAPGEAQLEHYHYLPSSFLRERDRDAPGGAARAATGSGAASRLGGAALETASEALSATPMADDRGVARFSENFGGDLARRALESLRASRRRVSFETNLVDLRPGVIFSMAGHPRADLSPSARLLVTSFVIEGKIASSEPWTLSGQATFAEVPYRPPMVTPKPRIFGLQSAVVVGPGAAGSPAAAAAQRAEGPAATSADDVYVDEFGRIRAQFHWDREGKGDSNSSIWMRVSQGWAGAGYGIFTIPRVGHEVLVAFLDGDPDSPIVVGRVHNATTQVPFKLPDNKTVSTWRSETTPGGGGFNEIRFEDAAGREMIFEHAQRDKNQIVRSDSRSAVGGNSTRVVQQNDNVSVAGERTKVVGLNQAEAVGLVSTEAVGVAKNVVVGGDESHLVGSKFSVTMSRGLTSRFAKEIGRVLAGPLASNLHAPIASLLGRIPSTALGGLLGSAADGPLAEMLSQAQARVLDVLKLVDGYANDPGPPPTSIEMVDRKIRLTTGESSIVLDGPNISLFADGNIMLHAKGNVGVLADGEAAVAASSKVLVQSRSNDLILQGGPEVHLNPFDIPPDKPTIDEELRLKDRVVPDRICDHCGAPMVADPDEPGRFVCSAQERLAASLVADKGEDPEDGVYFTDDNPPIHPDDIDD